MAQKIMIQKYTPTVFDDLPKFHGSLWDSKDLRTLRDDTISGVSLEKIAEKLGRTISACNSRLLIVRTAMLLTEPDGTTISSIKLEDL